MKTIIIAVIVFVASIATAQPRWMDRDDEPDRPRMKRGLAELNLTAEQQKQFDKLHSDHQKKQIELRSKVQTLRIELRDLMREDSPDKKKVDGKIAEVGKIRTDMKLNHSAFWFDVNKILTPEQQKMWKERFARAAYGGRGLGPREWGPRGERFRGQGYGPGFRFRDRSCCW